jgi:hypothetical protein
VGQQALRRARRAAASQQQEIAYHRGAHRRPAPRMGRSRASRSPSKRKPALRGGLYPTIAVSDAVNCVGHAWAAHHAYHAGAPDAALGFACVAEAALVGTLRFGFSERLLARANSDLADLAAFVGLRERKPTRAICFHPPV